MLLPRLIVVAEIAVASLLMITLSSSFTFTRPTRSNAICREGEEFGEGVHPSLMPTSVHNKKRPLISSLASTAARDVDNFDTQQEDESQSVLYQKVIRIPKQSSHTFLIQLITYVQTMYELPPNLPMPFELIVPDDVSEDNDGGATGATRSVLAIESPLGSSLEVEIVGIYIDEEVQAGPSMAMVAVKKRNDPSGSNSSVSQSLFAASEKAITQSLDRGLQDLEEGRISVPISDSIDEKISDLVDDDEVDAAMKRLGYRNAVDSASNESGKSLPVKDAIIERDGLGNAIIESGRTDAQESTRETQAPRKGSPKTTRDDTPVEKSGARKRVDKENRKASPTASGEDYAVQMAKRRAEAMMETVRASTTTSSADRTVAISGGESDFAVEAAKRAAAKRLRSEPSVKADAVAKPSKGSEDRPRDSQQTRQKAQNLSGDEMFLKLQKIANTSARKSWTKTISKAKSKAKVASPSKASDQSHPPEKTEEQIRDDILKISRDNKEIQDELKAATDLMQDDEEDLSPEDLLAKVLKFGEEQEKEEKPGYGFVDGAMSKARELLKQEDQDLQYRELDSKDRTRMEEEDELKRIFGAGQTAVEDKLSGPTTTANLAKPSITDEDIDALIDAEDSIPRNARVLDDGLAELEVRMSKSSDGEVGSNGLFDVFSGPETYNPNVDPESAVNWPGAKEGTRTDVRLAADLSRALKQAKFAAAIVSQMREEEDDEGTIHYYVGTKEIPSERMRVLKYCVSEAVKAGIIEDPEILLTERSRLQLIVDEIMSQPEERLEEIAMSYKDLLLSDNLVALMKERLNAMAYRDIDARRQGDEDRFKEQHGREREILIKLAKIGQGLVKDAQALGAELEVSMLEIIRSICEVAMDPSHKDEEETAIALKDAVRDMRPLLDDAFVAYLKYAIAEEEGKLARGGVLDDPEHNRWLFVLKVSAFVVLSIQPRHNLIIVSRLSKRAFIRNYRLGLRFVDPWTPSKSMDLFTHPSALPLQRYIDHIWYILRMKTKSERKALLKQLVDVMPTMDIRPFVKVVDNIVGSLGSAVKGEFADGVLLGDMTNQLLQLQRDVNDILPPDRINELSKDADVWAAKQRELLLERRNATRQRLEAAKETGNVDVDEIIKPGHEAERFD